MRSWQQALALIAIVAAAAALRWTAVDWDEYLHYHPDERFILWVATSVEWPADRTLAEALDPRATSFNPYYWPADAASRGIVVEQDQPRRFAYGHLPLYLGVAATRLVERVPRDLIASLPAGWLFTRDILNGGGFVEFTHLTAVARALTGLVDTATVALVFFLGRRLYNPAVGLLAAAFLALNVMHIQLAHFFAFDPYMTFFVVLAVYLMVVAAGRRRGPAPVGVLPPSIPVRRAPALLAAAVAGLAVGAKFAAILLALPLAALFLQDRARRGPARLGLLLTAGLIFVGAFLVTNPFALLDRTCEVLTPALRLGPLRLPSVNLGACFLDNIFRQSAMVDGRAGFPFTNQYVGTTPFWYYVIIQLRWGMGWLLGVVAFAGFGWSIFRPLRQTLAHHRDPSRTPPVPAATWIVLAWTVPFFLVTGSFFVKFMRYLQPLVPFLMIEGAALVLALRHPTARRATTAVVLAGTALYALSFVNLYSQPHPWAEASRWIYDEVAPGALILYEQWDNPLPSSLRVEGRFHSRTAYDSEPLTWLTGTGEKDSPAKLDDNLALLAAGDYVVVASHRVYGVAPRLPALYPLSGQAHALLFDGALGYEVVYVAGRGPSLGGVALQPALFELADLPVPAPVADFLAAGPRLPWGAADESFLVYDQPFIMILANTGRLAADEMRAQFVLPAAGAAAVEPAR